MLLADGKVLPLKSPDAGGCCAAPIKADLGAARAITSVARQWAGRDSVLAAKKPDRGCSCKEAGNQAGDAVSNTPMSLDAFIQRARSHTFSIVRWKGW